MASAPPLRGLLSSFVKKHAIISVGFTIVATYAVKLALYDPRKEKYNSFYKTFDNEKEFIRLRDAGVFQSVAPGGGLRFEDEE